MRIPPDNGADTRLTRRRARTPVPGHVPDQRPAPTSGAHDTPQPEGTGPGARYGPAAEGAAGKGPVRGYPPVPGQPPPMYPPGQFAAWNRGSAGRAAPRHGQPDSGRHQAQAGWQTTRSDATSPQAAAARPEAGPTASGPGYYGRQAAAESEPDYSVLAVSDPAADVTSTQTWQAVGDGRATGIWTMPERPGVAAEPPGAARAGRAAAPPGAGVEPRLVVPLAAADALTRDALAQDALMAGAPAEAPRRAAAPPGTGRPDLGPDAARPSGPASRPRAGAAFGAAATGLDPGTARSPGRRRSGTRASPRAARRSRSRRRPGNVKVAITGATLLVLAAIVALSYGILRSDNAKPRLQAQPASKPTVAPSPGPSLGPYGDIGSRKSDPVPLTVAQLYPASYTFDGESVVLTASKLGSDCAADVSGTGIQSAVGAADCSQVVRATYLSASQSLMGTIGVFNLGTASGARKAAQSADAQDYVSQLTSKHGQTSKIGQGTGIEEAAAKGHYLILIWAEFTSLHKPKTSVQRTDIENFMTELLDNTVNLSLTNRMLTGSPS